MMYRLTVSGECLFVHCIMNPGFQGIGCGQRNGTVPLLPLGISLFDVYIYNNNAQYTDNNDTGYFKYNGICYNIRQGHAVSGSAVARVLYTRLLQLRFRSTRDFS